MKIWAKEREEPVLMLVGGDFNARTGTEGECTFTGGRGESVIDYIIGSEEMWDRIREIKVGYKIDSEHQPIEAVVKGKEKW